MRRLFRIALFLGLALCAGCKHQWIYVASGPGADVPSIAVFPLSGQGDIAPSRFISGVKTKISWPTGLALDANRNLYVANYGFGSDAVLVFSATANGNVAPLRVLNGNITTQVLQPFRIALDKNGYLYVSRGGKTTSSSVLVFGPNAQGDAVPVRKIEGPATNLDAVEDLAVDSQGYLYVLNRARVTVYSPGANGNSPPLRTIEGASTGIVDVHPGYTGVLGEISNKHIRVTAKNQIWIGVPEVAGPPGTTGGPSLLLVFPNSANGNFAPIQIYEPLSIPLFWWDFDLDLTGRIYVAGKDSVLGLIPGPLHDALEKQVIKGPTTKLVSTRAILVEDSQ